MTPEKIAIIGLGYVGLPVSLALARHHEDVVGYDILPQRVEALKAGRDSNDEEDLTGNTIRFTYDIDDLRDRTFFILTVPTPIDIQLQPDMRMLKAASQMVGGVLKKNDIVVFESTVYPGATEEVCGPVIEATSGLKAGVDFFLGYSPERINPGDAKNHFENIKKVVSAQTDAALKRVVKVYGPAVKAGLHLAPSIKVAEASKILENTQRDINIALINEFAMIFHRMGIHTRDVLDAAETKWNFLKFTPGLVGGHCIGVDPYYLTAKAAELGYTPQVILAGRRINDGMGHYIAHRTINYLAQTSEKPVKHARIGILGLTFKEDIVDIRNSKVVDIIKTLQDYGLTPIIHDPHADAEEVKHEYGVTLSAIDEFKELDALILAVGHRLYRDMDEQVLLNMTHKTGVIVDIKSLLNHVPMGKRVYCPL